MQPPPPAVMLNYAVMNETRDDVAAAWQRSKSPSCPHTVTNNDPFTDAQVPIQAVGSHSTHPSGYASAVPIPMHPASYSMPPPALPAHGYTSAHLGYATAKTNMARAVQRQVHPHSEHIRMKVSVLCVPEGKIARVPVGVSNTLPLLTLALSACI